MRNHLVRVISLFCMIVMMHQIHAETSVEYDCSNAVKWDDCAPLIKKFEEKQSILAARAREAKIDKRAVKIMVEGGRTEEEVRKYFDACDSGFVYSMTICAQHGNTVADLALNDAYKTVVKNVRGTSAESALIKAQRAWLAFRDATCDYESNAWTNGHAYSMMYLSCMTTLTNERTERLKIYAQCKDAGCPGEW